MEEKDQPKETETITPAPEASESKAKKGFMMSVDDIMNPEPDKDIEAAAKEESEVKDLIGDGAVGDIIGKLEREDVRALIDKPEEGEGKPKEEEEPKKEEAQPLKVTREPPPRPVAPVAPPIYQPKPAQPPIPAVSDEDQRFVDSLSESQRAQVEFLKRAEGVLPEKFKNASSKTVSYLKDLAEHLDKVKKDDEYADLDSEAAKFQSQNQPKFSEFDVEEARQEMVASKIRKEMEDKYDKRLKQRLSPTLLRP
jgi:hypothetical protein